MNIENTLIVWLNENTEISWSTAVPKGEAPFGTLERTGGGISDVVIDSPMVALQVWGKTQEEANALAYSVRAVIPELVRVPGVCRVSINSMYNFPDEKGGRPRYQIVLDIKTV